MRPFFQVNSCKPLGFDSAIVVLLEESYYGKILSAAIVIVNLEDGERIIKM